MDRFYNQATESYGTFIYKCKFNLLTRLGLEIAELKEEDMPMV